MKRNSRTVLSAIYDILHAPTVNGLQLVRLTHAHIDTHRAVITFCKGSVMVQNQAVALCHPVV